MADLERTVLDFYQISTLNPVQWPTEKDNDSDASDDGAAAKKKANRRKSRYQALERAVSTRSSIVPGSENSGSGVGNLVQKDEPDPLGTTESVVRTLKHLGVPLQDDLRLRNRFLLSSTTFSPALFLSQMHATADTQSLIGGLDVLSKSIDQKSASLKVLVESNFERFVRAKATIDNVYKEMKYRGADPTPPRPRAHSRHASRNSFRSTSGPPPLISPHSPATDPRKKNALIKESEYGVLGVKAPLLDVSAKAEDVWGPALGGREKEEHLKTVASSLDQYKEYVETSAAIADSIKRKDHETLVEEYTKARKFADEAKQLAEELKSSQPTDDQLYRILLAARMWHDVEEQVQVLKRDIWRRLISPYNMAKADTPGQHEDDQHMELITLLLELGVEDNPIWVWLLSRYDYLKSKIQSTAERSKVEIEILRRRLANAEKPSAQTIASHMRTLGRQSIEMMSKTFDSSDVIELWEMNVGFLSNLLSSQGILGEVLEFWQTVQGFIDGKTQRSMPLGYHGESENHHRLSQQGTTDLQKGTVELVSMIRDNVLMFFAGPPPEDISLLFSPMPPQSPGTPGAASVSGSLTPRDPRFNLDPNNPPPPSPKRGEAWEKFAFWPPWSNSLSGVHFLSKMLALVGSGASDMASITPVGNGDAAEVERVKTLVGVARERCVTALCAAWNRDAENIKYVEDWNRSPDSRDVTKMPTSFAAFEGALLSGMQKILYISEAMSRPGAGDIVLPPPTKLLQMVRSQYVTTLYKALSGMVENAERFPKKADDEWTVEADGYVLANNPAISQLSASTLGGGTIDAGDRNVRMLLTLSNLQALRSTVVPSLNTQFENAFSVKLTDETKTIRDVLSQIDARLFQSYTRPSIDSLRRIIRAGVSAPDWSPPANTGGTKPRSVRPYVYEALLNLVLVHTQVSTTAASLTTEVLSYLLEQASRELLEAFKARARYDLEALMQATLDVEFVAQTLSHYTTDRASELQSAIYQELDGRTDNDARARLQAELPEMRAVLKRLREASKGEFACFRKPKRAAGAGVGGGGVPGPGGAGLQRRDTGGSGVGSDRER
ncbi:exocyst complex component Sec5-domain-containing protein [Parachaetomium inaequale]|uniref:Exocyst complex component SEC5 n=1 Tax=Parachaetomium inaequale TaxID=2588326 RepID=A0AAN6STT3_9PEZI|nr:exocyst complex component Sec5-domain-containing protein [Parachaetomium inaequale]